MLFGYVYLSLTRWCNCDLSKWLVYQECFNVKIFITLYLWNCTFKVKNKWNMLCGFSAHRDPAQHISFIFDSFSLMCLEVNRIPLKYTTANEFIWWYASMGNFYIRNRLVECFITTTGQHSNPHSMGSLHYDTDAVPLRTAELYCITVVYILKYTA